MQVYGFLDHRLGSGNKKDTKWSRITVLKSPGVWVVLFDDSGLNINKLTLSLATELPVGEQRTLFNTVFH